MTHRALVAFEQPSPGDVPTYDIHFSRNGGEDLLLKHVLEAAIEQGDPKKVTNLPANTGRLFAEAEQITPNTPTSSSVHERLVDPTPLSRDVPRMQIGSYVDYVSFDSLFVCSDDGVETFLPVFLHGDVLRPYRNHATVYAWPRDEVPDDLNEVAAIAKQEGAPIELSGANFLTPNTASATKQEARYILEDTFHGLLQDLQAVVTNDEYAFDEKAVQQWSDQWVIHAEYTNLSNISLFELSRQGLLVELPDEGGSPEELWRTYSDRYLIAISLLLESSDSLVAEYDTPVPPNAVKQGTIEVFKKMLNEWGTDISPLSLSPFRETIKELNRRHRENS